MTVTNFYWSLVNAPNDKFNVRSSFQVREIQNVHINHKLLRPQCLRPQCQSQLRGFPQSPLHTKLGFGRVLGRVIQALMHKATVYEKQTEIHSQVRVPRRTWQNILHLGRTRTVQPNARDGYQTHDHMHWIVRTLPMTCYICSLCYSAVLALTGK